MARPNSRGLIYFSLDTTLDEKFVLIESKLGIAGFGVVIKLLQKIYSQGYFIEWNERELLKFKTRINGVDLNFINEVINEAIKWELFDSDLAEKYGILTSHGIQMRYIEGTQRRKEIEFIKEYLLVSQNEIKYPTGVNVNIKSVNATDNPEKDEINSQSKVNESILNKSTTEIVHIDLPEKPEPAAPVPEYQIYRTWEQNFGFTLPQSSYESLIAWHEQDEMEFDVICEAIKIAAGEGKRSLKYVEGILEKWRVTGVKTLLGAKNYQAEWKKQKEKSKESPTAPPAAQTPTGAKCVDEFYQSIMEAEARNG